MKKRAFILSLMIFFLLSGCSSGGTSPADTIHPPDGWMLCEAYWKDEEHLICVFRSEKDTSQTLAGEYNLKTGELNTFYEGDELGRGYPTGCVFSNQGNTLLYGGENCAVFDLEYNLLSIVETIEFAKMRPSKEELFVLRINEPSGIAVMSAAKQPKMVLLTEKEHQIYENAQWNPNGENFAVAEVFEESFELQRVLICTKAGQVLHAITPEELGENVLIYEFAGGHKPDELYLYTYERDTNVLSIVVYNTSAMQVEKTLDIEAIHEFEESLEVEVWDSREGVLLLNVYHFDEELNRYSSDLFLYQTETDELIRVDRPREALHSASISPDGSKLLYITKEPNEGKIIAILEKK